MTAAATSGAAFRLTDSTLRDGSHALSHQYTVEQVTAIVRGLDAAGMPVIEVSHGDGLGGSSFNYGFSGTDERELVSAAVAAATRARIAVLLLPGIGVADDLRDMADRGVQVARIATHCTEADIAEQHIRVAKRLGMEAVGFLMMAHMAEPEQLLAQARLMKSYGADVQGGKRVGHGQREVVVGVVADLAAEPLGEQADPGPGVGGGHRPGRVDHVDAVGAVGLHQPGLGEQLLGLGHVG